MDSTEWSSCESYGISLESCAVKVVSPAGCRTTAHERAELGESRAELLEGGAHEGPTGKCRRCASSSRTRRSFPLQTK